MLSCFDLVAVDTREFEFPSKVNSLVCPLWVEAFNILRGSAVESNDVGLLCCFVPRGDAVGVVEQSLPGLKRSSWVVGRNTLNPLSSVWCIFRLGLPVEHDYEGRTHQKCNIIVIMRTLNVEISELLPWT